jgi:GntR family transcriptional regulator, rspAB operon transcriptional repressor
MYEASSPLSGFTPPPSLRESVYHHLKDRIVHNVLRPGEVIAVDRLASHLGVSRTPVREALLLLEGDNLVRTTPNHGFVVAEIHSSDVEHVYEVRELIESHAAYAAATSIPDDELDRLWDLFSRASDRIEQEDFTLCEQCDLELHRIILQYSHNPILIEIAASLVERSLRIRYLADVTPHLNAHTIWLEHKDILKALRARDASAAREKMHSHLAKARERTLYHLALLHGVERRDTGLDSPDQR